MTSPEAVTNTQPSFTPVAANDFRAEVNGYTLRVFQSVIRNDGWQGLAHHGYELRHTAFEVHRHTREQVEAELLQWVSDKTAPYDLQGVNAIRDALLDILNTHSAVVATDSTLTAVRALLDNPDTTLCGNRFQKNDETFRCNRHADHAGDCRETWGGHQ